MKEDLQDKRAAALQATLELISEQGFHGTPMSQIAKQANIGVGTIYRYFSSKEDLINALYIEIKNRLVQFVMSNYAEGAPVREGCLQMIRGIIDYFVAHPAELSFVEQYENSPLITVTTHETLTQLKAPWLNLFKQAVEQNWLKPLPFEVLGTMLFGAVTSLAKRILSGDPKMEETMMAEAVEAIWDMIKR